MGLSSIFDTNPAGRLYGLKIWAIVTTQSAPTDQASPPILADCNNRSNHKSAACFQHTYKPFMFFISKSQNMSHLRSILKAT